MDCEKIEVKSYAGYRGEQSPRAYLFHETWIEVTRILQAWIEEDTVSRARKRCFRCRGSDWKTVVICYLERDDVWYLVK